MVALLGGLAALLLGLIGLAAWWDEFIWLLKGCIPLVLILAGALAAYLGSEELKDKRRAEQEADQEPFSPEPQDVDKYKSEVAELKAKLAALENQEEAAPPPPPADEAKEEEEKKD